jgi:hypothetical protein
VRCRQSSIAQRRLGHRPAHAIAARCPSVVAAKVLLASSRPSSSAATSVCVRLCASTPITTAASPSTWPPLAVTIERVAVAVGRTCLSRETDQAPMKSRPAALRHPAGGMTSNGHDQDQPGSMETSQPAKCTIARSH